jgi:acetate kinase
LAGNRRERGEARVTHHVVTLDAGSPSIKFALFEAAGEERPALASGLVEMLGEKRRFVV